MSDTSRLSPHVPRFARRIETRGVMFGVPAYGGMVFDPFMAAMRETKDRFGELGIPWSIVAIRNESLIQRARHHVLAAFLASNCDRLIFIDADIGFTADQVLRLLAHDRDLVAGMYRKKSLEREEYACNLLVNPDGTVRQDPETGALLARHLATGFMCIKRGMVERMVAAFPHLRYRLHGDARRAFGVEYAHALMDCFIDPVTLDYYSEDYAFCERWRALGGECWADPGLILEHWGTVCMTGDPMAHLMTPPKDAQPCPTPSPSPTKPSSKSSASPPRTKSAAPARARR